MWHGTLVSLNNNIFMLGGTLVNQVIEIIQHDWKFIVLDNLIIPINVH